MKFFPHAELKAAFLHAEQGGQALLMGERRRGIPRRGLLIDHDFNRLWSTARRYSTPSNQRVRIQRADAPGQHAVLKGPALDAALTEAMTPEFVFA